MDACELGGGGGREIRFQATVNHRAPGDFVQCGTRVPAFGVG